MHLLDIWLILPNILIKHSNGAVIFNYIVGTFHYYVIYVVLIMIKTMDPACIGDFRVAGGQPPVEKWVVENLKETLK